MQTKPSPEAIDAALDPIPTARHDFTDPPWLESERKPARTAEIIALQKEGERVWVNRAPPPAAHPLRIEPRRSWFWRIVGAGWILVLAAAAIVRWP